MSSRRSFVTRLASVAVATPVLRGDAIRTLLRADQIAGPRAPGLVADDELYWAEIQRAFDCDRTLTNLNNGGVSPTPSHVLEQMIRDLKFSNEAPTEHMWGVLEPRIESVRRDLANDFGCDPEELAIVRNASEANETMIFGLDMKAGDEVIYTSQNYPRMKNAWDQRVRREGIVVKEINIPVRASDADIVARYAAAITPRTRAIEIMHVSFVTGQILPVKEVVALGKSKGIPVFVDGAHAYGHFPMSRDAMGVDYYGTSLHKWIHAPIGTGFLYVRREKIGSLWPMMAANKDQTNNIRKYEEIGTHPAANHNAIAVALAFHRGIGIDRKWQRLRYLTQRWAKPLQAASDRVKLHTPIDDNRSGAIAVVQVEGIETGKLREWLWAKHRIITVAITGPDFNGLRVTPSVYTTLDDVDRFADAVQKVIRNGIV